MAIYAQRLFGVKCAGTFAQANASVTAPDGTVNIVASDPISFVNGINNVQDTGHAPLTINYTLFTVGTAAAPLPPPTQAPSWYWLQIP